MDNQQLAKKVGSIMNDMALDVEKAILKYGITGMAACAVISKKHMDKIIKIQQEEIDRITQEVERDIDG